MRWGALSAQDLLGLHPLSYTSDSTLPQVGESHPYNCYSYIKAPEAMPPISTSTPSFAEP